ncbi:iron chelate uptake ABC transporter family permease subunit, partial [Nocardia abscessus]|uniref:iron chelate uptake ABC transporter family permease subunit n=1 Tax=Nocardia abscessus TaxID=120957 RepID=UPI0024541A86
PFGGLGAGRAARPAPFVTLRGGGPAGARGRGGKRARARALGLAAIVLLTGAATAAVGPIAFLGLVVPHLARKFTGPDYRWLIPYSGLLGALLLLIADVAGRLVARPGELEVGAMLAVLGVPFFLAFVRRRKLVNL